MTVTVRSGTLETFEAKSRIGKIFKVLPSLIENATVRYVGGVLFLLLFGVVGVWAAQTHLSQGSPLRTLVQAFSEAALVSGVLAILVDPYLKRRMQNDSAWGALFGYLNPHAPRELREAIRELASYRRYYTKASWSIFFAWHDEKRGILTVTIQVVRTGFNIGPEPYRPNGRPWVLASTYGYRTEYLRYSLSCPGHIAAVDARGPELQPYIVTQSDGSVYLEESRLVGNREIPADASFESVNQARLYRRVPGYLPLHYEHFFESLTFTLGGPALNELYVRIQHPRQDKRNLPAEWKRQPTDARSPVVHTFGRATPGQVTLVSWGLAPKRANQIEAPMPTDRPYGYELPDWSLL